MRTNNLLGCDMKLVPNNFKGTKMSYDYNPTKFKKKKEKDKY